MTKTPQIQIKAAAEQFSVRAAVAPGSFNKEARTVEVTFGTEAPVTRYNWDMGRYLEILDFNPKSVRMERMTSKAAPVLDSHDRWEKISDGGVIGVIESASIANKQGRAVIRFSKNERAQRVMDEVEDGIINFVSVGYAVHEYALESKTDSGATYRATDWEPMEISFEKMPADIFAAVRSGERSALTEINITVRGDEDTADEVVEDTPVNGNVNQINSNKNLRSMTPEEIQNTPVDEAKVRSEAAAAERNRVKEIRSAAKIGGLDDAAIDAMIDNGTTVEDARKVIIDEMAKRQAAPQNPANAGSHVGADREREGFRAAAIAGVAMRGAGIVADQVRKEIDPALRQRAKKYQSFSLSDLARECLEAIGVRTVGMGREEIARRALQATGEFPIIMENVMNKTLLANYAVIPDTWSFVCKTGSVTDFRANHRYRTSSIGNLDIVNENGEYKTIELKDGEKFSANAQTRGGIIGITRQMIINDDMGAFLDLAAGLGRSAQRTLESLFYTALTANSGLGPTVNGTALFDASRNNINATGSGITVEGIDKDRQVMGAQKEPGGNDYIGLTPKVLLVPQSLGMQAKVLNASAFDYTDSTAKFQKPNGVQNTFENIIDTPRLSGTRRYLFADPNIEPVFEMSFLNGQTTPFMEMQEQFDMDGVKWKVRLDAGINVVGFRGAVTNAGA